MTSTGLCECGCGSPTNIVMHTNTKSGLVKGQHYRFVSGHNSWGRTPTADTLLKMATWKRQSPSAETRAKIAAALTGQTLSPETRARISAANIGKKRKPEAGRKISAALKGRPKSQAHRAALSAVNMGKRMSDASRAAMKATWQAKSYEERLAHSAPGRLAAHPEKHRGEHNRRWWAALSAEAQQRIIASRGEKLKAQWVNLSQEERARRLEHLRVAGLSGTRAARVAHPTTIELAVSTLLDALGVQYLAEHRIGPYTVDFLIPDRNIVVECDGSYWHSKPNVKARDIVRDKWLSDRGFQVVRLDEPDIRSGVGTDRLRLMVS